MNDRADASGGLSDGGNLSEDDLFGSESDSESAQYKKYNTSCLSDEESRPPEDDDDDEKEILPGEEMDELMAPLKQTPAKRKRKTNAKAKAPPKPRKKRAKKPPVNQVMKKLMDETKKATEKQKVIDAAIQMQYKANVAGDDTELPVLTPEQMKRMPYYHKQRVEQTETIEKKKEKQLPNSLCKSMRDPIHIAEDDMDKRVENVDECKIERNIWVKRTRYFPFNVKANHDLKLFYTTPTSLCCMWCTEQINRIPIPMPMSFSKPLNAFYVFGQYCSCQCMIAKADTEGKRPMARHMLGTAYGVPYATPINPAPSPYVMQKYGGSMTNEQYRATFLSAKLKTSLIRLPFVPFAAGIEEIEKIKTVIYEYGDESKVARVVNASLVISRPSAIQTSNPRKMQRSKFSKLPTIEEQIAQSERKLRLERQDAGLTDSNKPKPRTLKDFMRVKA
jgi:hypothetical protein